MSPPDAPSPLAQPLPWNLVADAYVDEVMPHFERYAEEALRTVGVAAGQRVVDVATGPGTLALLAARRGARVDALDFSDEMIARLRARAAAAGVAIDATTGDGMALPYPDATFDAGFSMFGLFVFADRDRGFRELRRVLVPGGRAVVTSWPPFARSPALSTMMSAVRARLPGLQAGSADAPLGDAATFTAEMTAAGFRDVAVREVEHTRRYADADDFWSSMSRTLPPLVMLARKLGDGWPTVAAGLQADLRAALGDGPLDVPMPAWLGVGTA